MKPALTRFRIALAASAVALLAGATVIGGPALSQDKPKRVSVQSLVQPLDNPWVVNNVRFQKEVAAALGIDLNVVSDQGNDDSNVAAMRTMVAAQPDGILFDPISQAAAKEDARLLEDNKMIGVTEDRLVVPNISQYKGEYLKAQVTQDNEEWGFRTMENLVKAGGKKTLLMFPPHGNLTLETLWSGAKKYLADHPEVTVVEESWEGPQNRETAIRVMQRFLVKYTPGKDFDSIIAIGSTAALAARYVLEQAGQADKVKIVTADDDPDVMKALKNNALVTTLGGHWMNGGFGLIVLFDILNGHKPLSPQPQFHLIQIDAATADAYANRFLWGKESPFTADEIRAMSLTYNPKANLPDFMANLWQRWAKPGRGF
jgi:ABC-type sugar transport system substrate-binding protein